MKTVFAHVFDAVVLLVFAFLVLLIGFGTSFAVEESYPNWSMNPGRRVMPPAAIYAGLGVIGLILISIFVRRLRRLAIILGGVAILGFFLLFYLIANDIIISRAPING